jgi:hypothetical protein
MPFGSSLRPQVQSRFRTHALLTMAGLAIVHTVCFALTVSLGVPGVWGAGLTCKRADTLQQHLPLDHIAFIIVLQPQMINLETKRTSMLALSRSGESQRYLHQVR